MKVCMAKCSLSDWQSMSESGHLNVMYVGMIKLHCAVKHACCSTLKDCTKSLDTAGIAVLHVV